MSYLKKIQSKSEITGEDIASNIKKLGILRVNGVLKEVINGMKDWDSPLTNKVIAKLREAQDLINEDARKMAD